MQTLHYNKLCSNLSWDLINFLLLCFYLPYYMLENRGSSQKIKQVKHCPNLCCSPAHTAKLGHFSWFHADLIKQIIKDWEALVGGWDCSPSPVETVSRRFCIFIPKGRLPNKKTIYIWNSSKPNFTPPPPMKIWNAIY